jgi:type IV secretion system protein TrbL
MDSTIFDDITRAFVTAMAAGTLSLGVYSLPLLGAFALIGWYWSFGRELAAGGAMTGEALAAALLYLVNVGVAYWILINLSPMATAAYETFLGWGVAAGGGDAAGLLVTPSTVVDMGFQIAKPLMDYTAKQTGWASIWNFGQILMYDLASTAIVVAFPLVAVALMLAQIEYHLAVMVGAVLIPFGIFGATAFLAEFCLGWITGGLIRVLVTTVLVGLGFPLFSTAIIALTPGRDPTLYSAIIVALISLLYAWLAWTVPNRAAVACSRVALGLSGSAVVSSAMTAARLALGSAAAVRGVSTLVRR